MGLNMQITDWLIVIALIGLMTYAVVTTRKYNRNVADFLAAGRCARKYVLGVAEGLSCVGAITVVAWFEMFYNGGFSVAWWGILTLLVQVLVAMSGWVAYRYRQTRALTLAQILETRYSRNFRIFSGLIIFLSGVINFGIFPAVAGRFFQYFWGIEPYMFMGIDLVYAGIMLALTAIALFFVFAGGQITIMITDFIQGTFASICLVTIVLYIMFFAVPWGKIVEVVSLRDSNPIAVQEGVTKEQLPDYIRFLRLGSKKNKSISTKEKTILTPHIKLAKFAKDQVAEGNDKVATIPNAEAKKEEKIPRPTQVVSQVRLNKGRLLPGTSYKARFTYQAPKGAYLVVMSPKFRIESACIALPESKEAKEIEVDFESTNIGYANIYFAVKDIDPALVMISPKIEIEQAEGQSFFNPYTSTKTKDFNFWFFLIQALTIFWTYKAWQGTQGYYGAAINAHEARMGGVIGNWRIMSQQMLVLIIPLAAYAVLYGSGEKDVQMSNAVSEQLACLPGVAMQGQLRTTLMLTKILPVGLLGAFSAFMLAAFIGTNGTYMHSWGSIFIQDVIMPFRRSKEPMTPQQHFNILRIAIAGVGVFAFFFSLFFEQNDAIQMFFAFTGNLWLGGAGAVIALGLYWKYGTTKGAYVAIFTGIVLALTGQFMADQLKATFPWYNAQWMMLFSMVLSTALYVVVSLIDGRGKAYDLDKLLHRGKYATEDATEEARQVDHKQQKWSFSRMIGIDSDFSFLDKILYTFVTCWVFVWGAVFAIGSLLHMSDILKVEHWINFWHFYVILGIVLGVITTIWFSIGGVVDLKDLLYRLRTMKRNENDDGSVSEDTETTTNEN